MMTEAQFEKMVDLAVWRRLGTDPAYRHAENAEQQAEREAEITREEEERITAKFGTPVADQPQEDPHEA